MVESGFRGDKKGQDQELRLGGTHCPPYSISSFLWISASSHIWLWTVFPTEQGAGGATAIGSHLANPPCSLSRGRS